MKQDETLRAMWKCFLVNSDGAASHFKQKYTIQFMGKLLSLGIFTRVIWNFGCPEHGKGVWDGLGGILKGMIARAILRDGLVFENTDEGKFAVFMLALQLLDNDEVRERYARDSKLVMSKWNIQWLASSDISRPVKEIRTTSAQEFLIF